MGQSVSDGSNRLCDNDISNTSHSPSNEAQQLPDVEALTAALEALPQSERAAVVAHVKILSQLSPSRRAALLTLTVGEDGSG